MTELLKPDSKPEIVDANNSATHAMGAVSLHENVEKPKVDSTLYHEGSINPGGESFGKNYYDRGVDEYLDALNHTLTIEDLRDKVIVDIGSGRSSGFGRTLNAMGAHVLSVNPALKNENARNSLQNAIDKKHHADLFWHEEGTPKQNKVQKLLGINKPGSTPERDLPNSVAALAQALPVRSESADVVLSVFGTPQYLHHLDPGLAGHDEAILKAYTNEVRIQDKELISTSFQEVLRVLKPGGKAYITDTHRSPGQTENINPYSPSDGSEVVEVLEGFGNQLSYEIQEAPLPDGNTHRVMIVTKNIS